MKVEETTEQSTPTIYCDLDGVIVNFDKWAEDRLGHRPADWELDKKAKSQFWKDVNTLVKRGEEFFGAMDPMPDAFDLWDYIKEYEPTILSATGHVKTAQFEKRMWVNDNLGVETSLKAILVSAAADKARYAKPGAILIDDRAKAIDPWIAAGGIGILHTSAVNTIAHLKELGL
jgi:hypothetical protein